MKLVIVGGVAGGASAAARARRLSEAAEIVLVERGPDVSFANCGLPYHIGGVIPQRDKLLVTTPARLRERFRLDVRTQSEVVAIDRARQVVVIRELTTGRESDEPYDRLILAMGAAPLRPPFPGSDDPRVVTLRNLADTDRIVERLRDGVRHVLVMGAGFIGLEVAENLVHRGIATTVVDRNDQILAPFDSEMTTPLVDVLRQRGVTLRLGASLERVEATPEQLVARLTTGDTIETSLVLLGLGVRPESQLAAAAGLEVGPRGGIRVNARMETSDPHIFAVGDAVETEEFPSGLPTQIPLAGPANRQGRIAADNVFGRDSHYRGTQGTAIIGLFGQTAAITGLAEKTLRQRRQPYRKIYVHPTHHAGYYPGAQGLTLKVLFDPETGRLLGAQGVGGAGVDKRIDILAVALQAGMTVYDLEEMELCYAPQFGSAKDPVNMAGFVAAGLLRGDHPQVDWETARERLADVTLLDVRTPAEYDQGHIPGATLLPVDELRSRLNEIPHDRPVITYCQVGQRGYLATRILKHNGYDVRNLSGGYRTFKLYGR
jgi:NADPH-dependent 2,4-dienoyl-CoA reductase/sulfur reductase-like enzyme/rhodanese-related sulfurtransferase